MFWSGVEKKSDVTVSMLPYRYGIHHQLWSVIWEFGKGEEMINLILYVVQEGK